MIPRLWLCTSHPWLEAFALPFHPLVILALFVVASLGARIVGPRVSAQLHTVSRFLVIAVVATSLVVALPGWVVCKLGANPNSIFVAARYISAALAWPVVGLGVFLDLRKHRSTTPGATSAAPGVTLLNTFGLAALALFGLIAARCFIPDMQRPWSLPYELAGFFFDAWTTDLASDECLAFRDVEHGVNAFNPWYPGVDAMARLIREGDSATPGVVAYVSDRMAKRASPSSWPSGISLDLMEFIASTAGDHPLLAEFQKYAPSEIKEMRACLHSGAHVKAAAGYAWACVR